jgi:hypothetical protein
MSIENIIFEDNDTLEQKATKTALIFAGSTELTKQLARLKVTHTKIERGFKTIYVLRHKDFTNGRIEVTL